MDEKSGLLHSRGTDISHPLHGHRQRRRCWKSLLVKIRVATLVCATVMVGSWAYTGFVSGCFKIDDRSSCSVGWVWASGGEVVIQPPRPNLIEKQWSFSEIKPSTKLDWKACEGQFLCARLEVPIDYNKPDGPKGAVALMKVPAKRETKEYKPSILINPGGPGGSGVDFALRAGVALQVIVGEEYPIIGFDPRGINNTTPPFDCFQENHLARDIFNSRESSRLLDPNSSDFSEQFLALEGFAKQCKREHGGESNIGHHVGTAAVTHDMISIVEAEMVENNLDPKDGKLWYWGFSYGTILGMTFAELHPDRVGRLIVDGVADLDTYYKGDWFSSNLIDTDKVMDKFYEYCHQVGPLSCKFYAGSSPKDIEARLTSLLEKLKREPILLEDESPRGIPEVLTYVDLHNLIFLSLYQPFAAFPHLAEVFADLEKGDPTRTLNGVRKELSCYCTIKKDDNRPWIRVEAGAAIRCGDASLTKYTIPEYKNKTQEVMGMSKYGDIWAKYPLYCNSWNFTQAMPFTPSENVKKTSFPLLFMSSTLDPVTPLRNAEKYVQRYKGASLLIEDSEGHCTLSSPSLCIIKGVRAYFNDGILPELGKVCDADAKPFLGSSYKSTQTQTTDQEKLLLEHWRKASDGRQQGSLPLY